MNETGYFNWLLDRVDPDNLRNDPKVMLVLKKLFTTDFRSSVLTDENRADDGLRLRSIYSEKFNMKRPCSVLEMIVGLAIRIEIDIMGEPGDDHPEKWFWIMIGNLAFSGREMEADGIIDTLLKRTYRPNGKGGLFPLKNPHGVDQRTVPIWDQMSEYLNERYI